MFCPPMFGVAGPTCVGSKCARWVPLTIDPLIPSRPPELRLPDEDGTPTGLGVCSDNLRAVPWTDPAAK